MDIPNEFKALAWPALGVLAGHLMRWSAAAKRGQKWLRMALFDLPAMIGLTLLAGAIARYVNVDPLVSSGMGVAAGYVGREFVHLALKRYFPEFGP